MQTTISKRRLLRDLKTLQKETPHGISGSPVGNDIQQWEAIILGPDGTVWEGGVFKLKLVFPEDYPNRPPHVRFTSRMFHPNIYVDGAICLDILQNQWSPVYDTAAILTSIRSLLSDPNPLSPANTKAAQLFVENRREYNRQVAACVSDSLR